MNVMVCNRCGQPVNPASAKCPHCGQPLRAAAPSATNIANATLATGALENAYSAQRKKTMIIAGIVAGLAIIVAVIFGIRASSLQASARNPENDVLQAHGARPGKVMGEGAHVPTPIMEQPATVNPNPQMPDDVYQWLKHLEHCEQLKVDIASDQLADVMVLMQKSQALGAGMGMLDPYDQSKEESGNTNGADPEAPGQYTKGKVLDFRPKWQELQAFFRSKTPPAECQATADDFDRAINEIPGMMGDIGDILNNADADPQGMLKKANKLQSGSYGDIDRYFARCDQKVGAICMKYKVSKWFNIKTDVMAGGLMGKFGNLGGAGGLGAGLGAGGGGLSGGMGGAGLGAGGN